LSTFLARRALDLALAISPPALLADAAGAKGLGRLLIGLWQTGIQPTCHDRIYWWNGSCVQPLSSNIPAIPFRSGRSSTRSSKSDQRFLVASI
jgi:hypothetical protein